MRGTRYREQREEWGSLGRGKHWKGLWVGKPGLFRAGPVNTGHDELVPFWLKAETVSGQLQEGKRGGETVPEGMTGAFCRTQGLRCPPKINQHRELDYHEETRPLPSSDPCLLLLFMSTLFLLFTAKWYFFTSQVVPACSCWRNTSSALATWGDSVLFLEPDLLWRTLIGPVLVRWPLLGQSPVVRFHIEKARSSCD